MIQRRVTILDREELGLGFEVYCTVTLRLPTKDNLEAFETAIGRLPEVVQCVTGACDYELRVVTRDMHAFDDFRRDKILELGVVSNIERHRDPRREEHHCRAAGAGEPVCQRAGLAAGLASARRLRRS